MPDFRITEYNCQDADEWNSFVDRSRNATFLLRRDFMEYHSDRFEDLSLIVRKGGSTVALLPANLTVDAETGDSVLHSHSGLTYGGFLLPERHLNGSDLLEIFRQLIVFLRDRGISTIDYKPIPSIYHRMPSQDDLYALFRCNATLTERNISCAIRMAANPGLNTQQTRNLHRALSVGVNIEENSDVAEFHRLRTSCLEERHNAKPVHTASELQLLHDRFPDRIRIFLLTADGEAQAGVCVFDTGMVAHAQYICSTARGRREGLLTLLFTHLFRIFADREYFDFGISNEDHGLYLNEGLYRQKSSLGGSGVVYDRYRIDLPDA